uniref:ATP-dependent DNA helicase n=1 Tax=Tanacetum cinerariifolium TaxID=118510 RepID=A0A6L2M102_TANCI|nr:DNA helicase [Tanacetum cinerariifolium]
MCEIFCQFVQKKQEEKQIEEEQAAKAQYWKPPVCYDDDDDEESSNSLNDNISELPPYSAITPNEPVLSTEEPDISLSMRDEHLDTIPATESDQFIKSGVENLIPIPKFSLTDDDSFSLDNIDYVEASPPDSELVSSEVMEIVIPEVGGIKASNDNPIPSHDSIISGNPPNLTPSGESEFFSEVDAFLAVDDESTSSQFPKSDLDPEGDMLLFESFLNDVHSSESQTKSSSTFLNSLLKETNNFHNSLPECTTFSHVLCDAECESDSSDDQSPSDEDVLEKIVSKPLCEKEIIPMKSLRTHDSSLPLSSKIDSLKDVLETMVSKPLSEEEIIPMKSLQEFAGELTLLKSIPPGIDETDCDFEEDIRLIEKLLYDNSSPRPPEEFVFANSDATTESFSPSPILVKNSDSLMEEIDLFCTPDYPMPPGIEDEDSDSERDILIPKDLPSNNSLSFAEKDINPLNLLDVSFGVDAAKELEEKHQVFNAAEFKIRLSSTPYVGENAVVCGPSYPLYKNQISLNFENPKAHVSSVSDNLIRTSAISDPGQFGTYATHQLDSDSMHQLPCIPTAANLVSDIATGMSHIVMHDQCKKHVGDDGALISSDKCSFWNVEKETQLNHYPFVLAANGLSTVPKVASDIGNMSSNVSNRKQKLYNEPDFAERKNHMLCILFSERNNRSREISQISCQRGENGQPGRIIKRSALHRRNTCRRSTYHVSVDIFKLYCLDGIRDASQDPSPSIVSIKRPPKGDNIRFKKRKKHLWGVTRFADPLLDHNASSICSNVEDIDLQYSKHSDEERISSELSNRNIHQSFVISPITNKSLCDTEVMYHAVWERQCELYFRQIGSVASAENGRPDELDCSYSNRNAAQGDCDCSCQYCGAMFWYGERLKGYSDIRAPQYHKCCGGGKIVMRRERDPPNYIKHMLKDRHFLNNIQAYNQMFAMNSFGAHIDEFVNNRRGPYVFKDAAFGEEANNDLDSKIIQALIHFLDQHNDLVQIFRAARDKCDGQSIPDFKIRLFAVAGAREYDLSTSDTLGAIVFQSGPDTRMNYDSGYYPEMKQRDDDNKRISMNNYYMYQLHERSGLYGLLFKGGRLFQQYVVGVYCCIEHNRIDDYRTHQNDIRRDYLSGVYDALHRGDRVGSDIGGKFILTRTFTGGPRYMYSHYLDALAICRVLGNSQFFITFTCNVNWPKIKRRMEYFPGLTPADRADVVVRVFEQKVHDFCDFLQHSRHFGIVTGYLYTIEFQKRGLPHCHTLLWVKQKIEDAQEVDEYIYAELPNPEEDPEGYKVVSEMMVHGPCGLINEDARKGEGSISRLVYVNPASGELFFPRMLLCHKKGCKTFKDIRTVNKVIYDTYRAACEALGLLGDDKEWHTALEEAAFSSTPTELRNLFVQILIFCEVDAPKRLWDTYWRKMSDDIPKLMSETHRIPNLHINDPELQAKVLYELKVIMKGYSKTVTDFGLPKLSQQLLEQFKNKELMEEKSYDRIELAKEVDVLKPKLNTDQRRIYDRITDSTAKEQQELIFVYGHGGTGKTFLWKVLINAVRSEGKIVLAIASSGIASLLLLAGKSVILSGDFRQTLPVKKGGTKEQIIAASIANSEVWNHFKVFTLTENMRLQQPGSSETEKQASSTSASWLLDVGNGNVGTPDADDSDSASWISIPEEYCLPNTNDGVSKLIDFIYDKQTLEKPNALQLQQKAIVCPRNNTADMINSAILSVVAGESSIYKSSGEALPFGNDGGEVKLLYPTEYLNSDCISDLKPGSQNKVLEAKVYRKWVNRKQYNPKPSDYCCMLIDREGNAIQANMNATDITYFIPLLQDGAAYRISNFIYIQTNNYQQTLDTETTLKFGKYTKFDSISSDGFPKHYFNFSSYNQLSNKIYNHDRPASEKQPTLTDYIGCLIKVGNIMEFGSANTSQKTIKTLDIENLNGNVVELALWDDMARNFNVADYNSMERPVIITVSSCALQLLATNATYYYLKPDIPNLQKFLKEYKIQQDVNPPLEISKERFSNPEDEKSRNRFAIAALLQQNPETRDWHYASCSQCNQKVFDGDDIPQCVNHGPQPNYTFRYNFKAAISDGTGTGYFTFFTPNGTPAVEVLEYPCTQASKKETSMEAPKKTSKRPLFPETQDDPKKKKMD